MSMFPPSIEQGCHLRKAEDAKVHHSPWYWSLWLKWSILVGASFQASIFLRLNLLKEFLEEKKHNRSLERNLFHAGKE